MPVNEPESCILEDVKDDDLEIESVKVNVIWSPLMSERKIKEPFYENVGHFTNWRKLTSFTANHHLCMLIVLGWLFFLLKKYLFALCCYCYSCYRSHCHSLVLLHLIIDVWILFFHLSLWISCWNRVCLSFPFVIWVQNLNFPQFQNLIFILKL